jgi:integrase
MGVKVRFVKGKWHLVIHYKGKRVSVTVGPGDKGEREALVAAEQLQKRIDVIGSKALREFLQTRTREKGTPLFKDYAQNWLTEIQHSKRPTTLQQYEINLRVHLIPYFGKSQLDEINYRAIKSFILEKIEESKSRNTIKVMLVPLRSILKEAMKEELISSNPAADLGDLLRSAEDPKTEDPFTQKEVHRIIARFKDHYSEWYEFAMTLHRTGMRIGEVMALRWRDVDFEKFKIHVRRNLPSGLNKPVEGDPKTKRSKNRKVDMSSELAEVLRELQTRVKEEAFSRSKPMPEKVFVDEEWQPKKYGKFHERFQRVQSYLKIRYRSPHQLRHTFASVLLTAGKSITYVSAQLGDNPLTVFRTYAHYTPGEEDRGVEILDQKTGEQAKDATKTQISRRRRSTGTPKPLLDNGFMVGVGLNTI